MSKDRKIDDAELKNISGAGAHGPVVIADEDPDPVENETINDGPRDFKPRK